ncbi:hypothetical protein Q7P37_006623 [Cladosporium fusiforme]
MQLAILICSLGVPKLNNGRPLKRKRLSGAQPTRPPSACSGECQKGQPHFAAAGKPCPPALNIHSAIPHTSYRLDTHSLTHSSVVHALPAATTVDRSPASSRLTSIDSPLDGPIEPEPRREPRTKILNRTPSALSPNHLPPPATTPCQLEPTGDPALPASHHRWAPLRSLCLPPGPPTIQRRPRSHAHGPHSPRTP